MAISKIDRLRAVQHPLYPWLKVDMRNQAQVEESRRMESHVERGGKAKRRIVERMGKDLDGAFRLNNRCDKAVA